MAAAARPALGPVGFTLVGVAALLSTFSAVNATLYGDGRLAYMLARDGELPEIFERRVWSRPIGAVTATGCFALLIANFLDVTEIAMIASAGFLLIFTSVNLAACKLAREIGSSRWIPLLSALASGAALATLLVQASKANSRALTLIVASWTACVVGEFFYQRVSRREFRVGRRDPRSGEGNGQRERR